MNSHELQIWTILLLSALAIVLAVLYIRFRNHQMLHQERMAALEKGVDVPLGRGPAPWSPRLYLLRGLIWSFGGAALIVCLLGIAYSSQRPESAVNMAYRAGNLAQSLSIPLDQAKQLVEKDRASRVNGMPPGVALLGVIPLAIGLAYLVFYYSDESRKLAE